MTGVELYSTGYSDYQVVNQVCIKAMMMAEANSHTLNQVNQAKVNSKMIGVKAVDSKNIHAYEQVKIKADDFKPCQPSNPSLYDYEKVRINLKHSSIIKWPR